MNVDDAAYCQKLGKGNFSEGVRICIRTCRELEQRVLDSVKRTAESRPQPVPGQVLVPDEGFSHEDMETLARHRALPDNGFD